MQVTGSCHCGQIRFSAEVDESKVIVCHCTDCQVMASSAFRIGAIILREGFHLEGQTKEYCKIGTSGSRRIQVFCPECATGIYSYTPDNAQPYLSLRLGGVHQLAQLTPVHQIWRQSALPWLDQLSGIPCSLQQEVLAAHLARSQAR